MNKTSISRIPILVGNGRLARHWKHYLTLENLEFLAWTRQSPISFAEFAAAHADRVSCVYLLVSDGAIESFYREHRMALPATIPWFHASGALVVDGMLDAHPMMTFSTSLYELELYRSIAFTTAASLARVEEVLLADLQNTVSVISPENKPLYHALCVLGVAGTGSLWNLLEREWQSMGIAPSEWKPYQAQIFSNISTIGRGAITGPWVRGDKQTTASNLGALRTDSARKLYEVLKGVFDEYREH